MRNKDVFVEGFENMTTIFRYLYMGEKIVFENSINVPLELSMSEDGDIYSRNLNFPNFSPTLYDPALPIWFYSNLVGYLKKEPANNQKLFESRWDEIETEVSMALTLNKVE